MLRSGKVIITSKETVEAKRRSSVVSSAQGSAYNDCTTLHSTLWSSTINPTPPLWCEVSTCPQLQGNKLFVAPKLMASPCSHRGCQVAHHICFYIDFYWFTIDFRKVSELFPNRKVRIVRTEPLWFQLFTSEFLFQIIESPRLSSLPGAVAYMTQTTIYLSPLWWTGSAKIKQRERTPGSSFVAKSLLCFQVDKRNCGNAASSIATRPYTLRPHWLFTRPNVAYGRRWCSMVRTHGDSHNAVYMPWCPGSLSPVIHRWLVLPDCRYSQ